MLSLVTTSLRFRRLRNPSLPGGRPTTNPQTPPSNPAHKVLAEKDSVAADAAVVADVDAADVVASKPLPKPSVPPLRKA